MNNMAIETERKFLIKLPTDEFFSRMGTAVKRMVQTYLTVSGKGERRIRLIEENGTLSYVYTEKLPIAGTKMSREERERKISADEYSLLRREACSELEKVRYSFPHDGHIIEVDVYPHEIGGGALDGMAVMEIELASEDEPFSIPDEITVIRELTGTREFSNKTLAKKVQ